MRPTQISLRLVKADSAGFFCCMHTQTLLCELWQGMSMATKGWLVSHEVYLWSAVIVLHLHVRNSFNALASPGPELTGVCLLNSPACVRYRLTSTITTHPT